MKPALSVIFFTVMSGAGYGLWCWLGLGIAAGVYPLGGPGILVPLAFGFLLVTAGLLASTAHLGRPGRAWRALTQWRSSWLSREGVAALASYAPMLGLAWLAALGGTGVAIRSLGGLLALGALATIVCTANIYRSLKTVAAWRLRRVLALYGMFALLSGGLWLWAWLAFAAQRPVGPAFPAALLALAVLAAVAKADYWRCIDALVPVTAGQATGLGRLGVVRPFEAPATEETYLTREMAFVLARKHARALRQIAQLLFAALPIACLGIGLVVGGAGLAPLAALAALAGLFVERWLFFAQARHAVAAYFPART